MKKKLGSLLLASVFTCSLFTTSVTTKANILVDEVTEEQPVEQEKKSHRWKKDLDLTDEQKELIIQKKAELKEKYLANIDNMSEDEKKEALKKYKEELFAYMEKELGIDFKRKLDDDKPKEDVNSEE